MKTGRPRTTSNAILAALQENAEAGISCADLAQIAGCTDRVAKQSVCRLRMSGHVIGSRRVNERAVKYFYGDEKKLKTWHKPKSQREKVYDALVVAGPAGLSGAELKAMCTSVHSAKNACEELKHSGRMVGRRWVGAESWRYFLTQEDMAAAYLADRAMFKPKVKEKPSPVKRAPKPKAPKVVKLLVLKPSRPKPAGPQGEAINPHNVQPVVCPGANVERFRPTRVEPYFSALMPGIYAAGDTWAARVYG